MDQVNVIGEGVLLPKQFQPVFLKSFKFGIAANKVNISADRVLSVWFISVKYISSKVDELIFGHL